MALISPPVAVGTQDVLILAKTILGEAEGEPFAGKIAVAWVVVNRAIRRRMTVAMVCLQPQQFSCWNEGSARLARMERAHISEPYFRSCYGVACLVLAGEYADPTRGAQFYFTREKPKGTVVWPPSWAVAMEKVAEIGAHDFYREG